MLILGAHDEIFVKTFLCGVFLDDLLFEHLSQCVTPIHGLHTYLIDQEVSDAHSLLATTLDNYLPWGRYGVCAMLAQLGFFRCLRHAG